MKFIRIKNSVDNDEVIINIKQITYISESAKVIRLSDGLIIHTDKRSIECIVSIIGLDLSEVEV